MLKPNHIGLKEEMSWKVDIKSLYSNNMFIWIDELNRKFGAKLNTLNHSSLKNIIESNIKTKDVSRLDTNEQKVDSH